MPRMDDTAEDNSFFYISVVLFRLRKLTSTMHYHSLVFDREYARQNNGNAVMRISFRYAQKSFSEDR